MQVEVFDEHEPSRAFRLVGRDQILAGILDGSGSWGNGVEAAAWNRKRLLATWETTTTWAIPNLEADIRESASHTPEELRDVDFGWSFSAVVLVFSATAVSGATAGLYEIELIRGEKTRALHRPKMLVDELVGSGKLTRDEALTFEHRHVYLGPLVGDYEPARLGTFSSDARQNDMLTVTHLARRAPVARASLAGVTSAKELAARTYAGTIHTPAILARW